MQGEEEERQLKSKVYGHCYVRDILDQAQSSKQSRFMSSMELEWIYVFAGEPL